MDIKAKNAFAKHESEQEEKALMSKFDDKNGLDEYEGLYKDWKEKEDNKYS